MIWALPKTNPALLDSPALEPCVCRMTPSTVPRQCLSLFVGGLGLKTAVQQCDVKSGTEGLVKTAGPLWAMT